MKKNRVLVLILIVSMALNLAFIASRLYSKIVNARPPAPPAFEFRTGFRIDPAQKKRVEEIIRRFKIDSIMFKEDIVGKRIEILEELGNPGYDVNQIREKTGELNQIESQLNDRFIDTLLEISDALAIKQRLRLLYQLSTNWYFFDHRPEKGGQHE
jgi:uncharacterized membrane protein